MIKNFLIILVTFPLVFASHASAGDLFFGSVKKVIDGDSLLIVSGKKTIEVRLYGVDCPEYNQPFSNAAKDLAKKRVYGKKVRVYPEYYDPYKRLVAIVEYRGQTLNSELVRAGLAWVYPNYCRKKICRSWKVMEKSAQNEKKGLWSATHQIPPWKWKRIKRGD